MVSGTFHVIYSIGFAMQELDMKLLWQKPNPPPNLSGILLKNYLGL